MERNQFGRIHSYISTIALMTVTPKTERIRHTETDKVLRECLSILQKIWWIRTRPYAACQFDILNIFI